VLRAKKVPDSTTAFSFDVARKFWRRTIQEWRCQRSMVVRAVELWLTMHTLDWQRGGRNTLNSTKLLFSMDSVSPWAAKIVGNKFCHGSRKLRRNVGKLRRNLGNILVMFPLFFFLKQFWKNRTQVPRHRTNFSAHLSPMWSTHTNENYVAQKMIAKSLLELRRSMEKIAFWHKSAAIAFLDI